MDDIKMGYNKNILSEYGKNSDFESLDQKHTNIFEFTSLLVYIFYILYV